MKNDFEKRLRALHDAGNELSRTESVEGLCRMVVELGRERLGFDRLSIWFVDRDRDYIVGSYGVNESGEVRNEFERRILVSNDPALKEISRRGSHSVLETNTPLRDHTGKMVGTGAHIVAAIWNGEEIIGYLHTDNLLEKKAFTDEDREILELFASTFGHLYSLKKAEEALQAAYAELKKAQDQLIHAAKMEVVGQLASGVAHEVKNPLAVILQGLDYLSNKVDRGDDDNIATLQRMERAVKKANDIVKGLLDFSAVSRLDMSRQNLNNLIEESLVLVRHELDKYHISILRELYNALPDIRIDKNKIEQVLINILLNAVNYMPEGGTMTIKTGLSAASKGGKEIFVEIEDTGPGIPENVLSRIFDPFFTTRLAAGGTGLGLSIAKNIIDMHGAKIVITNKKSGHGAKAVLEFKV